MQALDLIKRAEDHEGGPAALARALDVPPSHVSNWKQGVRTCPPDMRARMAAIAGVDPMQELVEGLAEGLSDERRAGLMAALALRKWSISKRVRRVIKSLHETAVAPFKRPPRSTFP